MQDNPAKSPKTFQPRDCADCSEPFTPKSGRQVRCTPCREGPARPVCGADDCTTELRRDNKTGYCEEHKYATARAPVRHCVEKDCGKQLRADNESGYCKRHSQLTPNVRRSREERAAEARAASQGRRDARDPCEIDECPNRIRSDNTLGRCNDHRYLPLDLPECSVDGCGKRLYTDNVIGRCQEHRGLYWAADARKCGEGGCGKTLHADNVTGYCHKHRDEWRKNYNREYYEGHQPELVKYARFYREVYADEHRAYSRGHYAEHGRISPEAQRAAAARRRQRAAHGMDELDRFLSAEYRKAIRNDPCFYCGDTETHHVDHFFPIAKGGTDAWANLVRACADCNLSKYTACGTAFLLRAGLVSLARAA
jgi:5-methylcytosine-specific restriction endonuclease McrA